MESEGDGVGAWAVRSLLTLHCCLTGGSGGTEEIGGMEETGGMEGTEGWPW